MPTIPNFPQPLMDEHMNWHLHPGHPELGGRTYPMGSPGSGLEFLTFHHQYIAQFHAWYDPQPFADQATVAPWHAIPPELQNPAVGWNMVLANQVSQITTYPSPFPTEDALGIFIEGGVHGWLHGAAAAVYNEPVLGTFQSPMSTYFYKLHGLVDYWWAQWQQHRLHKLLKAEVDLVKIAFEHIKLKDAEVDPTQRFRGDPPDWLVRSMAQRIDEFEQRLASEVQRVGAIEKHLGSAFIRPGERPTLGQEALKQQKEESH